MCRVDRFGLTVVGLLCIAGAGIAVGVTASKEGEVSLGGGEGGSLGGGEGGSLGGGEGSNETRSLDDASNSSIAARKTQFEIYIPDTTWDTMASCSRAEYHGANDPRIEPVPDDWVRPDKCNYQKVRCSYKDLTSGYHVTSNCQVKRKGWGSWKELHEKPSFKIKKFENNDNLVNFGKIACEYCPPGSDVNDWNTNKVTLNNQIQHDGEIDAYKLFSKYIPTPLAERTTLKLYKGDVLQRQDTYAMLETIDDKRFVKKWFGDNYVLYEVDLNRVQFERFGGIILENQPVASDYECPDDPDDCEDLAEEATEMMLTSSSRLQRILDLTLEDMNRDNILKYYAGEVSVHHWDGACMSEEGFKNNYYVVFNGSQHFYIPSGTDQTFQCIKEHLLGMGPKCLPMIQCFADTKCHSRFSSILEDVKSNMKRQRNC